MHQSFYAYNLTRPYPYRWFTPVLVVGGCLFTTLFSLLNVATNGYELTAKSTSDPNSTLVERDWLSSVPSFLRGVRSQCDSTIIPLQSLLKTNNSALPYTVDRVWRRTEGGGKETLGSLVYHNQPLQECRVIFVETNIEVQTRSASQLARIPVGGAVETRVECFFESEDGRTFLQLSSVYDPIPTSNSSVQYFLYSSPTKQANLYWGSWLMRIYWADIMRNFAKKNSDEKNRWISANLQVKYSSTRPEITDDDMRNPDFFYVSCFFNRRGDGAARGDFDFDVCSNGNNNITALSSGSAGALEMPDFWSSYNILSKVMYYTTLADLGRDDRSIPNLLSRRALVEELSRDLNKTRQGLAPAWQWGIGPEFPSGKAFSAADYSDADMQVTPSVLASTYLCKVRRLKDPARLVMSVLVSNLVFLSALWTAYVWVVDVFLVGRATILELEPRPAQDNGRASPASMYETEMTPLKPEFQKGVSDGSASVDDFGRTTR